MIVFLPFLQRDPEPAYGTSESVERGSAKSWALNTHTLNNSSILLEKIKQESYPNIITRSFQIDQLCCSASAGSRIDQSIYYSGTT